MVSKPWPPPTYAEWQAETKANPGVLWWVKYLIPGDSKVLVSGPPKKPKKTLAVMEMIRSLITAKDQPGIQIGQKGQVRCAFFEYEGAALPLAHFGDWMDKGAGFVADWEQLRWAHRYNHVRITDSESVDRICQLVEDEQIKGVVIDTFTKSAQANENDARALSSAFENLDKVIQATKGGFVVYIHHLRKAADPWDEDIDVQVRGNTAFTGDYDHHLAFREGYAADSVHLYTRSKVDHDRYFRWTWDINQDEKTIAFCIFEFETDNPPPAGLVQECVEEITGQGVNTLRQLAEAWDTPKVVTRWLVESMVEAGMLQPTAKGWKKV